MFSRKRLTTTKQSRPERPTSSQSVAASRSVTVAGIRNGR